VEVLALCREAQVSLGRGQAEAVADVEQNVREAVLLGAVLEEIFESSLKAILKGVSVPRYIRVKYIKRPQE
jgi:DNA-binding TFAR19-related protein (PDSD5 family)